MYIQTYTYEFCHFNFNLSFINGNIIISVDSVGVLLHNTQSNSLYLGFVWKRPKTNIIIAMFSLTFVSAVTGHGHVHTIQFLLLLLSNEKIISTLQFHYQCHFQFCLLSRYFSLETLLIPQLSLRLIVDATMSK